MSDFLKKNFVILLAFALPIILIVVIAASAYLPSLFISTEYDFVYSLCTDAGNYYSRFCDNYLSGRYSVVEGEIVVNPANPDQDSDKDGVPDIKENYTARIFFHDTEKNESREITLEEAKTLSLNNLLTSPDGVTVSEGYERGANFFFLFDGGSSRGFYLTKGRSKSALNLINEDDRYYYPNNFQFIGWVLPEKN